MRNARVYLFPDGGGEAWATWRKTGPGEEPRKRKEDQDRLSWLEESKREANEERAARRAKGQVRRFVRHNGLRVMLTLTFPGEGIHDYDQAYKLFATWVRRGGRQFLGRHYVAVPERHPGGHGIHWHVLVRDRLTRAALSGLRASWTAFLGKHGLHPSGGARWVRVHVKEWQGWRDKSATARAAHYASKYVSKSFAAGGAVPPGRQRYLVSEEGQPVPAVFVAETADELWATLDDWRDGDRSGYVFDSREVSDWQEPFRLLWMTWEGA